MSQELDKIIRIVFEKWKTKLPADKLGHPHEEAFAAFVENKLAPEEADRIKNHVLSCEKCSRNLAASIKLGSAEQLEIPKRLLDAGLDLVNKEIASSLLEIVLQAKEKLLNLVNTTGDVLVGQELVPAAILRGRKIQDFKDSITILKDFGPLRVEVRIETKDKGAFNIQVQIKEKLTQAVIKDLRVSLIKDDLELESYLSDSGKVVFEHVILGKYIVEVSNIEEKMASVLIDIKA
jgi:hypothetical protein